MDEQLAEGAIIPNLASNAKDVNTSCAVVSNEDINLNDCQPGSSSGQQQTHKFTENGE